MQWSVESSRRKTDINATSLENQSNAGASASQGRSTLRFGAGCASETYGLPVGKPLDWKTLPNPTPTHDTPDPPEYFEAQLDLDDLAADEILVPSLVLLSSTPYAYRISLTADGHDWRLAPVTSHANFPHAADRPASAKQMPGSQVDISGNISTAIDLFKAHAAVSEPRLTISLASQSPPSDYLFVISRRPQKHSPAHPGPMTTGARPVLDVPPLSQMVQPKSQRQRTCSPTALSMVMAYYGEHFHPRFIDDCKDPATGLFGVWPLNMVQAGRRGFVSAVELIQNWDAIADWQGPFIASVSFAEGELAGAPLQQTDGHLVVVCGTNQNSVLCRDPAAESAASTAREYDLVEFTQAWLGSRGAAYFVHPANAKPGSQT